MQLQCECTMPDVVADNDANFDSLVQYGNKDIGRCPFCYNRYWYNPQHENEMFDLKSMNTFCDPVDTSWRPIETAPTDGTIVECYAPGAIYGLSDLVEKLLNPS